MNMRRPAVSHRFSVALKLALVSWAVTIVTLLIFVAVIVPDQKRTFQENLTSKARGLSASLHDVIAGAAVTEDYSIVVDHCRQVLQGDDSIAYIVITKNDGFSLVHEAAPPAPAGSDSRPEPLWRQQQLAGFWHPDRRQASSGIERVPVFERRVFHYAAPFDYSGIEWGWINVGLSVQAYDQSVTRVYSRTLMLAVACIAFSLIVSILYARRLVKPIKVLQAVQQRVSAGDLAARADIDSRDEVESLADSFNAMTETLQQRDRILECVRQAAQAFLMSPDWNGVLREVLAGLGEAARVSRIDVFSLARMTGGHWQAVHSHAWSSPALAAAGVPPGPAERPWQPGEIDALIEQIKGRGSLAGPVGQLDPGMRVLIEPLGFSSLILTPVLVDGTLWGILCLGECRGERHWTDAEQDSLRAIADMLGATIARHRVQAQLLEAKETLEQRVLERTNELQDQVRAKEQANAELAKAQQSLIDLSRQAGMAEVATGVLHNVGNVLNSVNVSTTLIRDRLRHSEVSSLKELSQLLRQHEADLPGFLTADARGSLVLPFLFQLSDQLQTENQQLLLEQDHLIQNIDHIKEIVRMQQGLATISGYLEPLALPALVDQVIGLSTEAFLRHRIELVRDYADAPTFMLDKHKVMQILVNLLQNAKQALKESGREGRRLLVSIACREPHQVDIAVQDNGIGIPPENLTRIFSHGFSTRKDGHGFGLHVGALAAKEMGGRLSVHSDGDGKGATFTLRLPLTPATPEGRSL